jgi:hypothetical protein
MERIHILSTKPASRILTCKPLHKVGGEKRMLLLAMTYVWYMKKANVSTGSLDKLFPLSSGFALRMSRK